MSLVQFNDFMKISDFFYKTLGMFAYKDPQRKISLLRSIIMNIIFYINIINLAVIVLLEMIFFIKAIGQSASFLEATAIAPCIGFCLLSYFKLYYFWINSEELLNLIQGLQLLFPKTEETQESFKVMFYLKKALRLGIVYSLSLSFTIWAFNLIPLFWSLEEYFFENKEFAWRLAYLTWYPFEINTAPVYAGIYFTHILAGCTAAGGAFSCDIFMFNIIILICMNFKYIEENIGNNPNDFNKFIKYHQIVLE